MPARCDREPEGKDQRRQIAVVGESPAQDDDRQHRRGRPQDVGHAGVAPELPSANHTQRQDQDRLKKYEGKRRLPRAHDVGQQEQLPQPKAIDREPGRIVEQPAGRVPPESAGVPEDEGRDRHRQRQRQPGQ